MTENEFVDRFEAAVRALAQEGWRGARFSYFSNSNSYRSWLAKWVGNRQVNTMCPIATVIRHEKGISIDSVRAVKEGYDHLGLTYNQGAKIIRAADIRDWKLDADTICFANRLKDARDRALSTPDTKEDA